MNKKKFVELVQKHKEKFMGLTLIDATLRYGNPYTTIAIYWKNTTHTTSIISMKGQHTDSKIVAELEKFKRWANEIIINSESKP